jgi:hypothetical protein
MLTSLSLKPRSSVRGWPGVEMGAATLALVKPLGSGALHFSATRGLEPVQTAAVVRCASILQL